MPCCLSSAETSGRSRASCPLRPWPGTPSRRQSACCGPRSRPALATKLEPCGPPRRSAENLQRPYLLAAIPRSMIASRRPDGTSTVG
eukprot:5112219-Pyramimonas_sp.AAC.2